MGRERWFRGDQEGRERPLDWYALARERGIPEARARELYEEASRRASLQHREPGRYTEEIYIALLEEARLAAHRPSPGKVTRTMRLQAERAGQKRRSHISRLTGQPIAPGKRTLTSYLVPATRQHDPGTPRDEPERAQRATEPSEVHRLAAQGIAGAGSTLPHLERIQRAFGAHDISNIVAHVGGPAAQASQAMGARAYATGQHIAFADAPDLHTAAHEAAHVVQQRAGLSLPGGIGSAGDIHERQADAVADAVVHGKSAEALLPAPAALPVQPVQRIVQRDEGEGEALSDAQAAQLVDSVPAGVIVQHLGGLRRVEREFPQTWQRVRQMLSEQVGRRAFDILYRRDDQVMAILRQADTLQVRLDGLARQLDEAGHEQALAFIWDLQEHYLALNYQVLAASVQRHGEVVIDFWHDQLVSKPLEELVQLLREQAMDTQRQADREQRERAQAVASARERIGRPVAMLQGIVFDDELTLEALLEPEAGAPTESEALAFARMSGQATAVVQIGERWHVFRLDQQLDYDDVWRTEQWQEHRTELVPVGRTARVLTTTDGYVLRVRGSRFFGGDQSAEPARYLEADEQILAQHGEQLGADQAVNLFKQLVLDTILALLADSRADLLAARQRLRPMAGAAPDARASRQLRQDAAALRRHLLAASRMAAEQGALDDAGRQALEETLSAIGRIVTENPAAAMMVVDERDADERDRAAADDEIVDRLASARHDGHAAWQTIEELDRRLENIEAVQRHLHANPDSVLDLEPLHAGLTERFTGMQRVHIELAKAGHRLGGFAAAVGMTVLELGLLVTGLMSGGTTAILAGAVSTGLGLRSTQQLFAQARTVDAMTALDMSGALALASESDASSARSWAWIGAALSFVEVGGLIRSARHLGRLRMVLDSPELSRVLSRSDRQLGELARELGMSERELVRQLRTLRGSAREALVARVHQAAERGRLGGRVELGTSELADWERAGYRISDLERIHAELLARQDIGAVVESLRSFGIPADRELVSAVKRYNFDSAGLVFAHENFAAWNRLARGQATVRDAQYLVHEMAEVSELQRIQQRTGFDFVGRDVERMSDRARKRWRTDFNRYYLQAHARALEAEYDFVAQQVAQLTGGRVRISRTVAAAIDPHRDEARMYMLVDGLRLMDHPSFYTWRARAREVVEISAGTQERLRLSRGRITLEELIARVRMTGRP